MSEEKTVEYIDLLLRSGNICRIEFDSDIVDEVYERINNAIRCGDPIPMGCIGDEKATINGTHIDRVYPHQIEAML